MASYAYTGLTGGNWSTSANWTNMATNVALVSPNLPTSADDCYLHNKTVVIDAGVTVNVNKISNKSTTGFTLNATAGGSATVALTTSYCPTITVGSGGIESSQATTAGNTIAVSGTTTTANVFQVLCSGDIIGGYSTVTTSNAIYITATNTKITITANNITGGVTASTATCISYNGSGCTIYVNCTNLISGNIGPALYNTSSTGFFVVKATTITAGTSISAIQFRGASSNSSTQYIGYTWNHSTNTETILAITDINASATFPAISSSIVGSESINTTPVLVQVTNLNGSSQGYLPILSYNAKITATNIKYYSASNTLVTYQNQTPSASTAQQFWDYATASATTPNSLGKLIVDNLNATISSRLATSGYTAPDNSSITAIKTKTDNLPSDPASNTQVNTRLASASYTAPDNATISTINTNVSAVKTATDRIPTNPASVQSTGDQIATLQ